MISEFSLSENGLFESVELRLKFYLGILSDMKKL